MRTTGVVAGGPAGISGAAAALLLTLLATGSAVAQQTTTGTIAGSVTSEAGAPLQDATVTLSSERGVASETTDHSGRFLFPYLTPGPYDLRVELTGYQTVQQTNVGVGLGRRVELGFVLSPGAFEAVVDVNATTPVIDLSSVATGLTLGSDLLEQVPVGRKLSDAFYLAPGVSSSGGAGASNPSISGASGLENQYVVDGVNINHPRYGGLGVYARGYGSIGSGVAYDFIDEIQVRTAGTEAEYAQSTGGLVNVITKSGSNEWRGSAFGYLSPDALESGWRQVKLAAGAVNTVARSSRELGLSLGGPLLRDRLFFFVAADHRRDRDSLVAPEGFPLAELGPVDRVRTITSYATKVTASLSANHRLDASAFGDPGEGDVGPQNTDALLYPNRAAFSSLDFGGHTQTLRYHGVLRDSWLLETSFGHATHTFRETPSVEEWQLVDETTNPPSYSGGMGRYSGDSRGESFQYELKSTNLMGVHDLRYGASLEDVSYDETTGRTGPPVTLANGLQTGSGGIITVYPDPAFGRIYRVTSAQLDAKRVSRQRYLAVFLQDKLYLGNQLTVSGGVRYERQEMVGKASSVVLDNNWAPRLGVVWDPTGEGRIKLYSSYGIFFARIPNDMPLLVFQGGTRVRWADYFDAALTEPVPDGVVALDTAFHLSMSQGRPYRLAPGAGTTYIQEAVAGMEVELRPQLAVGVRYLYRDMPRVLEDIVNAAMVLYLTGEADEAQRFIGNPEDGSPPTLDGIGAFEQPIHRYQAVELTANRRYAENWTLLASYRWSRLEGTYEGFFRNDNGQAHPALTSLFDFPTNDPSYTEIGVPQYGFRGDIRYLGDLGAGPLPTDRTHQLKVYGTYTLDGGLSLGAGVWASSGRPLTPMAADPVLSRIGDIPEAPRGSGIVTEDGFRTRTPYELAVDLHGDYRLGVGRGQLVVAVDVFNLLNRRDVLDYDQNTERAPRVLNPDFGQRIAYQEPRRVRLGVRYEF